MKFLPNINRTSNCWNRSGIEYTISVTLYYATNNWNSLNHEISHDKKNRTHETPTGKHFGPTKYIPEKILDLWHTLEKNISIHKITTRRNYGYTKHPKGQDGTMALDPRDQQ